RGRRVERPPAPRPGGGISCALRSFPPWPSPWRPWRSHLATPRPARRSARRRARSPSPARRGWSSGTRRPGHSTSSAPPPSPLPPPLPYFGFLVPTPTPPELAEAPDELFTTLHKWTEPEVKTAYSIEGATMSAELGPGRVGVDVLAEKRVGGFDATVLRAQSPE